MEPIDLSKYKSTPIKLDAKTRGLLLIAVVIFLFCLLCLVQEDVKGKTGNSSFGSFKDFQPDNLLSSVKK